jgi:hypothetical protein
MIVTGRWIGMGPDALLLLLLLFAKAGDMALVAP